LALGFWAVVRCFPSLFVVVDGWGGVVFEPMVVELNRFEVAGLGRVGLGSVTAAIAAVRSALDGLEVRVTAVVDGLGDGGVDGAELMRNRGRVSRREAARRAGRARRLREMPNTRRRLAEGELTAEHVDELTKAAEQVSAAEVDDDAGLLDLVGGRPADVAGRDVRDWVQRHQRDGDREERYGTAAR